MSTQWYLCVSGTPLQRGLEDAYGLLLFLCADPSVVCFVSGTPLQRGLEDAYGLLLFLCVDPYFVHEWWRRLLLQPYCHGHKVRNINL